MGVCSSHAVIEVKIKGYIINVKVPMLKPIKCSTIIKRRRKFVKSQEVGQPRFVLQERNF